MPKLICKTLVLAIFTDLTVTAIPIKAADLQLNPVTIYASNPMPLVYSDKVEQHLFKENISDRYSANREQAFSFIDNLYSVEEAIANQGIAFERLNSLIDSTLIDDNFFINSYIIADINSIDVNLNYQIEINNNIQSSKTLVNFKTSKKITEAAYKENQDCNFYCTIQDDFEANLLLKSIEYNWFEDFIAERNTILINKYLQAKYSDRIFTNIINRPIVSYENSLSTHYRNKPRIKYIYTN